MIVFFNGHFLEKPKVRISPDDRGFLFGDGTYEVIRIYHGRPFRLEAHLRRFRHSLESIRLDFTDLEIFKSVADDLIRKNGFENDESSLYIQITRGVTVRRHPFPDLGTPPTVYACVNPASPLTTKWEKGVKIILLPDIRWKRCDIKSVSLLANVMSNQAAKEQEAEEAVFIRKGMITEGTHTNVAAVLEGTLVTHPVGEAILNGITREVVLELCQRLDIPYREKPIPVNGFRSADEIMILGTTTEIMPVIQVDDWTIGKGSPGPVVRKLQAAFDEMTRSF